MQRPTTFPSRHSRDGCDERGCSTADDALQPCALHSPRAPQTIVVPAGVVRQTEENRASAATVEGLAAVTCEAVQVAGHPAPPRGRPSAMQRTRGRPPLLTQHACGIQEIFIEMRYRHTCVCRCQAAAFSLELCGVICHTVATVSEQQLVLRLPPSVLCHAILPCTAQDHTINAEIMQLSGQSGQDMFKTA